MGSLELRCYYKTSEHRVKVPADSSFADVKVKVSKAAGLLPDDFKLLYRGKERADNDAIYAAGVKDGSKLHLAETEAFRQRRGAELAAADAVPTGAAAGVSAGAPAPAPSAPAAAAGDTDLACVEAMNAEVDPLEQQVKELEDAVAQGRQLAEEPQKKKHKMAMELLTRQLLKLDQFECTGDARQRRKQVINRVNALCEKLEKMPSST
eukprot:jgi/Tetstr1/449891/TSEL_036950.t1